MNETTQTEPSNGSRWSTLRKIQIIGTLAGALLTTVILIILSFHTHTGPIDAEADWMDIESALAILLTLPAVQLCQTLGCPLQPTGRWPSTLVLYSLVIVTNSFCCFLVGTIVGWLVQKRKGKRKIQSVN
ncbi:MAG: hypothetical protein ABSF60_08150 [Verrucomicrobiota bacterium]